MSEIPQQPAAPQPPTMPPAKKDTTMGWLAHLLQCTWFIGPMVIWLVKKDEDKYAAFHGKQAMCWSLAVTVVVVGIVILTILLAMVIGPFAGCFSWLLFFLVGTGNLVYVIFGIVYTAQNKVFKYFFVADQFCKKEFAEAYPDAAVA